MPKIHHTFPRNFPVDGKLPSCCRLFSNMANKYATSWQQVAVMEFGKRHDTADTTHFCPRKLVTDLALMLRTCCALATGIETGVMDFGL